MHSDRRTYTSVCAQWSAKCLVLPLCVFQSQESNYRHCFHRLYLPPTPPAPAPYRRLDGRNVRFLEVRRRDFPRDRRRGRGGDRRDRFFGDGIYIVGSCLPKKKSIVAVYSHQVTVRILKKIHNTLSTQYAVRVCRQAQDSPRRLVSRTSHTTTPCSGSGWRAVSGIGGGTGGCSAGTGFTFGASAARTAFREWRSIEC